MPVSNEILRPQNGLISPVSSISMSLRQRFSSEAFASVMDPFPARLGRVRFIFQLQIIG